MSNICKCVILLNNWFYPSSTLTDFTFVCYKVSLDFARYLLSASSWNQIQCTEDIFQEHENVERNFVRRIVGPVPDPSPFLATLWTSASLTQGCRTSRPSSFSI